MKRNAVASTVRTEAPTSYVAPEPNTGGWREFMERGIKGLVDHVMIDELDAIRELATDQIKEVRSKLEGRPGGDVAIPRPEGDLA